MRYYDNYIVFKRFRWKTVSGNLNLPYGTQCKTINVNGDRAIICEKGIVCYVGSQAAYDYFAQNDDGNGKERGRLTSLIIKRLGDHEEYDIEHQKRWDKVWGDLICQKYKRSDYNDHWIWNYDFYNAPLHDLYHIAELVGVK